ncbi:MAG: hypothetical protein RL434_1913 [Pseudomonadota bacterium]
MCHQTVSLVARHLEANGIPTLCLGSALDILRAGHAPRAVFVDYPLGHSAGQPFDEADQLDVVTAALRAFEEIAAPGDLVMLPNRWPEVSWALESESNEGGDTREARDESPQWQLPEDREAAIAAGAWQP